MVKIPMMKKIANNTAKIENNAFGTGIENTSAKAGFSLVESLVALLIMALFFVGGLSVAHTTAQKLETSEAFSLKGTAAVAQLLCEDAGYSDAEMANLTDAQIRSIYGEDLDAKRVEILRQLLGGNLDLEELAAELRESGWSLSDSEVEALQEMTNGMFTDNQIRAYYGINPEDYSLEGMSNPSYFEFLDDENIVQIVQSELPQGASNQSESVSARETIAGTNGDSGYVLVDFFENLFFGE